MIISTPPHHHCHPLRCHHSFLLTKQTLSELFLSLFITPSYSAVTKNLFIMLRYYFCQKTLLHCQKKKKISKSKLDVPRIFAFLLSPLDWTIVIYVTNQHRHTQIKQILLEKGKKLKRANIFLSFISIWWLYLLVDNAIVQSVFSSLSHFCDQLIVFAWLQESSLDIQLHTFLGLLDAVVAKLDCAKKQSNMCNNKQKTYNKRTHLGLLIRKWHHLHHDKSLDCATSSTKGFWGVVYSHVFPGITPWWIPTFSRGLLFKCGSQIFFLIHPLNTINNLPSTKILTRTRLQW